MHLILGELQRRIDAGLPFEQTVSGQADVLRKWLVQNHPKMPVPAVGSIENKIRYLYRMASPPRIKTSRRKFVGLFRAPLFLDMERRHRDGV